MNKERFSARYSPLGIELQVLTYNTSYNTSSKVLNEYSDAISEQINCYPLDFSEQLIDIESVQVVDLNEYKNLKT